MLQIIIQNDDAFFHDGLTKLLQEIFEELGNSVCYSEPVNRLTVSKADIIIQELCAGEIFLCNPTLFYRKHGLIIGVVEKHDDSYKFSLPYCVNDMIFIQRDADTETIRMTIKQAWERFQSSATPDKRRHCYGCKHRTLTSQQKKIASLFIDGLSVNDISEKLSLNSKSVFSHKHSMMRRFNIKNDYQLMKFLKIKRLNKTIVKTDAAK